MKKLTVAVLIIGVFLVYCLVHVQPSSAALLPKTASYGGAATSTPASTPAGAAPGTTSTPATATTAGAQYKDGSYTGSVADAQWGYIQVKAIIVQGKITGVQFLQYPNERSRSVMINTAADPQLTSEAIQAQNSQVDIVTGATDSSEAFVQSLSDALSQAHA